MSSFRLKVKHLTDKFLKHARVIYTFEKFGEE